MATGDHTWKYKRSLFISYFKLLIAKSNHHHEKKDRTSTSTWCTDNSQHKQHTLGSSQGTWEWMPLTRSYLSQISHVSAPVPYETSCCVKSTYVNMPRSTFPVLNKRLPLQFYLVSIPNHPKSSPDMWHFPILTISAIPSTISAINISEYLGASSERNWLNNVSRPHLSNLKFLQSVWKPTNHRVFPQIILPKSSQISDVFFNKELSVIQPHVCHRKILKHKKPFYIIEKMQACLPRSFPRDTPPAAKRQGLFDLLSFNYKDWHRRDHWHQNILRGSTKIYMFLRFRSIQRAEVVLTCGRYMYVFMGGLHAYQYQNMICIYIYMKNKSS